MGSSHIKAKTQSYPKQTRSTLFGLNQSKLSLTQTTPHFTSPQPCPATTPTTPKVTRTRTNTQATTNPPQAPTQATASQDLNPTRPNNHTTGTTVLPTLKTNTAPATPTTTPTLNLLPAKKPTGARWVPWPAVQPAPSVATKPDMASWGQ